jgi:hypothetical protein
MTEEVPKIGNGGPPVSEVEINADYQAHTVEELIDCGKRLKAREFKSVIESRWLFGCVINRSGETVYGDNTAGRIAEEVGYSKSTIHKCKQFGEKYDEQQKESLLNGPFLLSWRDVALNLSVSPEDFLRTYRDSEDLEQFRNAVTQLRRTRKTRTQSTREPRKTRAELETENTDLRNRVSDLETENVALQRRIKELEGQQETSEANSESIEEPESAEDLPN